MVEQLVSVEYCIHGYHAYKNVWNTEIGDRLDIEVDKLNQNDKSIEEIIRNGLTVGHIPREI